MPRIEELYEAPPIEIELIGGYSDGRRMHVPDSRNIWLIPIPRPVTLNPDPMERSVDVEEYRWTGSIRDDGTRVFQLT